MSRWPAFGRCKRRLASSIGSAAAAAVQARLREHTLTVATTMAHEGLLDLQLAMSGAGLATQNRRAKHMVTLQGEGHLGLRMRRQLLRARRGRSLAGHRPAPLMIIGTDLPCLSRRDLARAIDLLTHQPLVLGPARDGGYWLLGLGSTLAAQCPAWLFTGMPWGSSQVLAITCERAAAHGIEPAFLEWRNDIDRLEDLSEWLG